jgi:hypothetical protein
VQLQEVERACGAPVSRRRVWRCACHCPSGTYCSETSERGGGEERHGCEWQRLSRNTAGWQPPSDKLCDETQVRVFAACSTPIYSMLLHSLSSQSAREAALASDYFSCATARTRLASASARKK